jgi:uroporphyrinogen III methyltransferase/synthase
MKPAHVYLIGAGPGEPSLISVRGLRYLTQADVVVHDHLVHPRLLRSVRSDAETIDVGAAAPQPMEQDAIGFLLADKSREGKTVARLKWGDPFVFDSGGKEALFLHAHGIPFEVVPGIPPSIGGPCYAGVPITCPEAGDALIFIRGHETQTPPDVDWRRIAPLAGTIVSYAAGAQLEIIIDQLLKHGRSPDERAALILRGTLPTQRTIEGTLSEVQAVVRDAQRRGSDVLVIGPVVGFRDHLRWFDSCPLFGKRVLVTRPRDQAGEMVERLLDLGAEPIETPMIRILPPDADSDLDEACATVSTFDWIVFTSANGVDGFLTRLLEGPGDIRDLKGVRLCAIGPATATRLTRFGLQIDLMPSEHRAEAVLEGLRAAGDLSEQRVLLPRADIARELLPVELRRSGADVVDVAAYRTVLAGRDDGGPDIYEVLLEQDIDAVTFTSASTVRNFVEIVGAEPAVDLLRTTVVAAIGPITADAARELGIETTVMPDTYTVPALIDALAEHFETAASVPRPDDDRGGV